MRKWIAAILTLVMLSQALPWTAFAATGDMITDAELQRALLIAGLQPETTDNSGERALFAAKSNSAAPLRLEAKESGYHPGMKPDETWDAQMLMDWLDDMLSQDIYNVTNVFTRADTLLERMATEDPAAYARFAENREYVDKCHKWALAAEVLEEEARFLHRRLGEYTVVIEQNTETLAQAQGELFDCETALLSEQIREAAEALEDLREDILALGFKEMFVIITGQGIIDGTIEAEFSAWLKAVLASEDGPKTANVSASAVVSTGYNTRLSRMASGQRVLSNEGSQDVTIQVITENEFAFIFRGVDNRNVGGVKATIKDLNGSAVKSLTSDSEFGSVVFNANDFVCDYDKEMELSLTVEAEALGYRDFSIPWLTMKRGGKRTETLALLSGPENAANASVEAGARYAAAASAEKPYVVSCCFNGYDILRQNKNTTISKANDASFDFELVVSHPAGMTPKARCCTAGSRAPSGTSSRLTRGSLIPPAPKNSAGNARSTSTPTPGRGIFPRTSPSRRRILPRISGRTLCCPTPAKRSAPRWCPCAPR